MKPLVHAAVALSLLAPVLSFAQTNAPLTRAQVRAELVQLEQAGWRPAAGSDPHYPEDLQAAEARVAQRNGAAANSGYGSVATGASQSGGHAAATETPGLQPIYFGQ